VNVRTFAQRLASNKKSERDTSIAALGQWLRAQEKSSGLSDIELLKLWKGLFYCLWMADKIPVQEELAANLAELLTSFRRSSSSLRFFRAFCLTMRREWPGLDRLRLDKFYTLIRKMISVVLRMCKEKPERLEAAGSILRDEILDKLPNGLRFHIADLFLDELQTSGWVEDGTVPTELMAELLSPFYCTLGTAKDNTYVERVIKCVFAPLAKDKWTNLEGEEYDAPFANLDLAPIAKALFSLGADQKDMPKRFRQQLYAMATELKKANKHRGRTAQPLLEVEEQSAASPAKSANRNLKDAFDHLGEDGEADAAKDAVSASAKKSKKKKKKKKTKEAQESPSESPTDLVDDAAEQAAPAEAEEAISPPAKETPVKGGKSPAKASAKKSAKKATTPKKLDDDGDVVMESAKATVTVSSAKKSGKVSKTVTVSQNTDKDGQVTEEREVKTVVTTPTRTETSVTKTTSSSTATKKKKKKALKTPEAASTPESGKAAGKGAQSPLLDTPTAESKRVRWAGRVQAIDHRSSYMRTQTTPLRPAATAKVPRSSNLKRSVSMAERMSTAGSTPGHSLKKGLQTAQKNKLANQMASAKKNRKGAAEHFF